MHTRMLNVLCMHSCSEHSNQCKKNKREKTQRKTVVVIWIPTVLPWDWISDRMRIPNKTRFCVDSVFGFTRFTVHVNILNMTLLTFRYSVFCSVFLYALSSRFLFILFHRKIFACGDNEEKQQRARQRESKKAAHI